MKTVTLRTDYCVLATIFPNLALAQDYEEGLTPGEFVAILFVAVLLFSICMCLQYIRKQRMRAERDQTCRDAVRSEVQRATICGNEARAPLLVSEGATSRNPAQITYGGTAVTSRVPTDSAATTPVTPPPSYKTPSAPPAYIDECRPSVNDSASPTAPPPYSP